MRESIKNKISLNEMLHYILGRLIGETDSWIKIIK